MIPALKFLTTRSHVKPPNWCDRRPMKSMPIQALIHQAQARPKNAAFKARHGHTRRSPSQSESFARDNGTWCESLGIASLFA
jgi:hypothetical protein